MNINDCDFTLALFKNKMVNVYLQPAGFFLSKDHLFQATMGLCHIRIWGAEAGRVRW